MSVETPGYRLLFTDATEYEDLILIVAPIARSVVEDTRVYSYTKGLARTMRYLPQDDQRARRLLEFIHDRRNLPEFLRSMWAVLQAQSELNGLLKGEPEYPEAPLAAPATRPILVESASSAKHVETTLSPPPANDHTPPHSRDHTPLKSTSAGISIPNPLHDNADRELLLVRRKDEAEFLYKIMQTEIRYGSDDAQVPYSILAFRLERGKDMKQCLKVELMGKFRRSDIYKYVNVKELWHAPRKENKLTEVESQITSAKQIQVQAGFNGKPVCLVTVGGSHSIQSTLTRGQRIDARFNDSEATFDVTLALDDGIDKNLRVSVAESVFFFVVLKLEKIRQPMLLELKAVVTYVSSGLFPKGSPTASASTTKEYSGDESHDIIKGPPEISTT